MTDKRGTGDELARIPLNDDWDIVFKDDGDGDAFTHVLLEDQYNGATSIENGISHLRREMADDGALMEMLGNLGAVEDDAPVAEPTTTYNVGHFVCDDCHRTFVARKNQTPDGAVDTCPECHEVLD